MRNVLLILGVAVLFVVATGVMGSLVLRTMMTSPVDEVLSAGRRFGELKTAQACEREGFRRLDACESALCPTLQTGFMLGCIEVAVKPPTYCQGVVEQADLEGSKRFIKSWCAERGHTPETGCKHLAIAVQRFCV